MLFGDGRSAGARRYRDLIKDFASELGDPKALPATSQQIVRRLAQVSVELEFLEATRASGDTINALGFATLINSQRRLLRDFGALKITDPQFAPYHNPANLREAKSAASI